MRRYVVVRLPDGSFVSSPTSKRALNPNFAATFNDDEERARQLAEDLGGEVVVLTAADFTQPAPLCDMCEGRGKVESLMGGKSVIVCPTCGGKGYAR